MSGNNRGVAIVLIAVGALLLVGQFLNLNIAAFAWPLFVMIPGILLLVWAFVASQSAAPLAIPGSIVTTVGLILFYQNATGRFESWSYAWGLILAAVGVGIAVTGLLQLNEKMQKDGRQLATLGLGLFAAFGAFFELFIFRSFVDAFWWRYLLPLALVGGGLYLLMRQGRKPEDKETPQSPPEPQV